MFTTDNPLPLNVSFQKEGNDYLLGVLSLDFSNPTNPQIPLWSALVCGLGEHPSYLINNLALWQLKQDTTIEATHSLGTKTYAYDLTFSGDLIPCEPNN